MRSRTTDETVSSESGFQATSCCAVLGITELSFHGITPGLRVGGGSATGLVAGCAASATAGTHSDGQSANLEFIVRLGALGDGRP